MQVIALLEAMEVLIRSELGFLLLFFAFVEAGDRCGQIQVDVPAALRICVCQGLVVELLSDEGEHRGCLIRRSDDVVGHDVDLLPAVRCYFQLQRDGDDKRQVVQDQDEERPPEQDIQPAPSD